MQKLCQIYNIFLILIYLPEFQSVISDITPHFIGAYTVEQYDHPEMFKILNLKFFQFL